MEKETCNGLKTEYQDEYWGYWIKCECGYGGNLDDAKYCGGCGKKIQIVGTKSFVFGLEDED